MVYPSKSRHWRPSGCVLLHSDRDFVHLYGIFKVDSCTLPPTTIRAKAREFAIQEVAVQKEEFRSLGIMADWDNENATYRTLGMFLAAR